MIPIVTSRLDNWPHGNNTSLSCTLCPHSRISRENIPGSHPSEYCSKASTLNLVVFKSWAPEKKMYLVVMSSINQILYAFLNCIVPYLYSLRLPLVRVRYRFSRVSHHLEACQEPLLVRALLHRGSLPALVGPGCHRPTCFRLVDRKRTRLNSSQPDI